MKNLVLGLVKNYNYEQIRPFVASLRATGYTGDVCLLYSDIDHDSLEALKKHDVQLVPFTMGRVNLLFRRVHVTTLLRKLFESPLNRIYPMHRLYAGLIDWMSKRRPDAKLAKCRMAVATFNVYCVRYPLYYLYLSENRGKYDMIMLADVRDVLFQRDPFEFESLADLNCFLEDDRELIKDCPYNSNWLKTGYGEETLRALGDNVASCSGVTVGRYDGIMHYLELMVDEMVRLKSHPAGMDQGVHNYLLYKGKLNGSRLFANGEGPILTMGKTVDLLTVINKEGRALNNDGSVVNVLHQYDRHIEHGRFQLDERAERLLPVEASVASHG